MEDYREANAQHEFEGDADGSFEEAMQSPTGSEIQYSMETDMQYDPEEEFGNGMFGMGQFGSMATGVSQHLDRADDGAEGIDLVSYPTGSPVTLSNNGFGTTSRYDNTVPTLNELPQHYRNASSAPFHGLYPGMPNPTIQVHNAWDLPTYRDHDAYLGETDNSDYGNAAPVDFEYERNPNTFLFPSQPGPLSQTTADTTTTEESWAVSDGSTVYENGRQPRTTTIASGTAASDISEHTCGGCNKPFESASKLKKHARIHTPLHLRKHGCSVCLKRFVFRKELVRHNLKHGGRGYSCVPCEKGFKRGDHLKRHVLTPSHAAKTRIPRSSSSFSQATSPGRMPVQSQASSSSRNLLRPASISSAPVSRQDAAQGDGMIHPLPFFEPRPDVYSVTKPTTPMTPTASNPPNPVLDPMLAQYDYLVLQARMASANVSFATAGQPYRYNAEHTDRHESQGQLHTPPPTARAIRTHNPIDTQWQEEPPSNDNGTQHLNRNLEQMFRLQRTGIPYLGRNEPSLHDLSNIY